MQLSIGWIGAALALLWCGRTPALQEPVPDCIVSRVVDGDTLDCRDGRAIRLIGMDTPEMNQGTLGRRARQALLELAPPGKRLRVEMDVDPTDRYHRVLAWLWDGPVLINEAMVAGGWAVLYTVPPNVRYVGRIREAQRKARERNAGFWAEDGFSCMPSEHRRGHC